MFTGARGSGAAAYFLSPPEDEPELVPVDDVLLVELVEPDDESLLLLEESLLLESELLFDSELLLESEPLLPWPLSPPEPLRA